MQCSKCGSIQMTLVRTSGVFTRHTQSLCRKCIIGCDVPVFRPLLNTWHVGEIKEFNKRTLKHHIHFPDDSLEWVSVDPFPWQAYIKFSQNELNKVARQSGQLTEAGSFKTERLPKDATKEKSQHSSFNFFTTDQPSILSSNVYTECNKREEKQRQVCTSLSSTQMFVFSDLSSPPYAYSSTSSKQSNFVGALTEVSQSSVSKLHGNPTPTSTPFLPSIGSEDVNSLNEKRMPSGTRRCTKEDVRPRHRVFESCDRPISSVSIEHRYVDHPKPHLEENGWTAQEDYQIYHIYVAYGCNWGKISSVLVLKGRTEKSIKDRFHQLEQNLEKDIYGLLQQSSSKPNGRNNIPDIELRKILPRLAALSKSSGSVLHYGYEFGPFSNVVGEGEICHRCNLIVPSLQTGELICQTPGWCQACTGLPPYLARDTLRECLSLRRS